MDVKRCQPLEEVREFSVDPQGREMSCHLRVVGKLLSDRVLTNAIEDW